MYYIISNISKIVNKKNIYLECDLPIKILKKTTNMTNNKVPDIIITIAHSVPSARKAAAVVSKGLLLGLHSPHPWEFRALTRKICLSAAANSVTSHEFS